MARTVPIVQMTAVLGDVTVTLPATSENVPLTPLAVKPFADTRTIAVVLAAPVAVQAKLPVLGAAEASVVNVLPPLRLNWILTVDVGSRFVVHVIVCAVPIVQLAPAAGDVTATRRTADRERAARPDRRHAAVRG